MSPFDASAAAKPVVWKLNLAEPRYASVRYRCLMPLANLRALGIPSLVIAGGESLRDVAGARAVVLVKTFGANDLALARAARAAGVPVLVDLCDNIFTDDYGGAQNARIRGVFAELAALATGIVTTGPALADIIRAHVPAEVPVHVIPDQAETLAETRAALDRKTWSADPYGLRKPAPKRPPDLRARLRSRAARLVREAGGWHRTRLRPEHPLRRLARGTEAAIRWGGHNLLPHRLRHTRFGRACRDPRGFVRSVLRRLTGAPPQRPRAPRPPAPPPAFAGKTVVWFGHHGSSHGRYGIVTLTDIADAIAAVAKDVPLRLLVVSDSLEKYESLIAPLPFPTAFSRWDPLTVFDIVAASDVCVLPNSRDPFSTPKSANRAVMALSLGVPVVATRVPALEPLAGCVVFDDWEAGLRAYLTDPNRRAADLARARAAIEAEFSGPAVARRWAEIIAAAVETAEAARPAPVQAGAAAASPAC